MTETKTLACCKSPDTSARVTVTHLTRGSRSSNRIVSLATSRTTSVTRANRYGFMAAFLDSWWMAAASFHLVIQQFRRRMPPNFIDDTVQGGTNVAGRRAHQRDAQN